MEWFLGGLVVLVGLGWAMMRLGSVSPRQAKDMLKAGAVVIDVRTAREFEGGALPGVVNVPLDDLIRRMAEVVPDRSTPVLLHCKSGGRSGLGTRVLRRMGYSSVGNLGSLARAEAILSNPGLETGNP